MIKKILLLLVLSFTALALVSCAGAGRSSGSFGRTATSLPAPVLTSNVAAPAASAAISSRAIADMNALSAQQGRPDYRIGPSDLLDIKVFQADELSRQVRVDQRGDITLPLMGTIRAAGLTQIGLEQRLATLMGKNLLQNPQVGVFIKEFTAQRVTIEGEVGKQGVFPLSGQVTVLQAIAMAGGLGEYAVSNQVMLFRKQGSGVRTYQIDLDAIGNGLVNDPYVQNNDRIVVQRNVQRVTVDGEVNRPGVFPYKDRITVLQAVAMAGGVTSVGKPDSIAVIRLENGGKKIYTVNLNEIRNGKRVDPMIQNGDLVVVDRSNGRYWLKQVIPILSPLRYVTGWLGG